MVYQSRTNKDLPPHSTTLAVMYYNGDGVVQDYREAVKWYTKAAQQGDVNAQYNLGVMYDKGEGVEKDDREAVKWYTKAVEQEDASAQVQPWRDVSTTALALFKTMVRRSNGIPKPPNKDLPAHSTTLA